MSNLSTLVGIIAGLIAIAGGVIAFFEYLSKGPGKKELIMRSVTIVVIVLLVVGGGILFSSTTTIIVHAPTNPLNNSSANSVTPTLAPPTTSSFITPTTTSDDYSAIQPGSGCDTKGGGKWTSQGIDKITCGTQITINTPSRGYLYLQLPNNKPFSSNNRIGIIATLQNYLDSDGNCVGLDEQDANTGFLGEYCNSGKWYIYSITSSGVVIQTLDHNVTPTQTPQEISLTLKNATLSFSLGSVVLDTINVSSIHPIEVAITYRTGAGGESIPVTNFSYITLSS